jgi:hypothetical protein
VHPEDVIHAVPPFAVWKRMREKQHRCYCTTCWLSFSGGRSADPSAQTKRLGATLTALRLFPDRENPLIRETLRGYIARGKETRDG